MYIKKVQSWKLELHQLPQKTTKRNLKLESFPDKEPERYKTRACPLDKHIALESHAYPSVQNGISSITTCHNAPPHQQTLLPATIFVTQLQKSIEAEKKRIARTESKLEM